ncbi:hypothetical protein D3C72_1047920 [compost metagenome]
MFEAATRREFRQPQKAVADFLTVLGREIERRGLVVVQPEIQQDRLGRIAIREDDVVRLHVPVDATLTVTLIENDQQRARKRDSRL